jgi:hypothetical protein
MRAKAAGRIENLFMAAVIGAAIAVCVAPFVDAEIPSLAVSPDAFVRGTPEEEPESELVAPVCEPVVAEEVREPGACEPRALAGTRNPRSPAAARF